MSETAKENLPFELAKQLHEQYAANDNAKITNVIGFLAAITFIFVGFGYVYVQPYLKDALETGTNYLSLLLSADIVATTILVLMSVICTEFGYSTRRDHVVITRIRQVYAEKDTQQWFNGKYCGFGKNIIKFLPNYYLTIFVFIQLFIGLLAVGCHTNNGVSASNPTPMRWYIIAGVAVIINICVVVRYFYKYKQQQTDEEKK